MTTRTTTRTTTISTARRFAARAAGTVKRLLGLRRAERARLDAARATARLLHDVGMGGTAATAATRMMRTLATDRS